MKCFCYRVISFQSAFWSTDGSVLILTCFRQNTFYLLRCQNVLTPVQFNGWRLSCVKKICCFCCCWLCLMSLEAADRSRAPPARSTEALMEQKAPGGLAGLRCQPFCISALSSCDLMFQFSPFTKSVAEMSASCWHNCLVWFLSKPKSLRIPASFFLVTPAMPILNTLRVPSLNC